MSSNKNITNIDIVENDFEINHQELPEGLNPYTPEEERDVFNKYKKSPSKELKNEIIMHNLGLVKYFLNKYVNPDNIAANREDLFQEGVIGLMAAIDKYEPKKDCKFSTYAFWWIKQAITRYLSNNSSTVRKPVRVMARKFQIKKLQDQRLANGKAPYTWEEIRKMFGIEDSSISRMEFEGIFDCVSLDTEIGTAEHNNPTFLSDMIVDKNAEDAFLEIEKRETYDFIEECLQNFLKTIPDEKIRERNEDIIRRRLGIGVEYKEETLEEIGKEYGLSRERVRQIEDCFVKRYMRKTNIYRKLKEMIK